MLAVSKSSPLFFRLPTEMIWACWSHRAQDGSQLNNTWTQRYIQANCLSSGAMILSISSEGYGMVRNGKILFDCTNECMDLQEATSFKVGKFQNTLCQIWQILRWVFTCMLLDFCRGLFSKLRCLSRHDVACHAMTRPKVSEGCWSLRRWLSRPNYVPIGPNAFEDLSNLCITFVCGLLCMCDSFFMCFCSWSRTYRMIHQG